MLVGQGFPEAKVIVHYIGINVGFFTPDAALPRERSILFVGRLVEKKKGVWMLCRLSRALVVAMLR